jgi:hypothetical protein
MDSSTLTVRRGRRVASVAILASLLSSLPAGLPPALAVSTSVVISEFRTRGPNGGSDEFIELYNPSMSPVTIGGWKIKGSNSSGFVSTRATIPAGTILNPGCHYLLTNSSTSGGPYSGSVPGDQTYTTGAVDDGGLALTLPDDSIVDQVGIGPGSAFQEGSTLSPLTTNVDRGYERRPGGILGSGTDTDDNASDFQLVAPSDPQSSASPCVPGPGRTLAAAGPARLWVGLKNSDDVGTRFDLRLEIYINDTLVADGEALCVTGLTRSPDGGLEVVVPLDLVDGGSFESGDILSVEVWTRVGTTPEGARCGAPASHDSASGLRLYYDTMHRSSRIALELAPDLLTEFHLHSDGGACRNRPSPTATTHFVDATEPMGEKAKCRDSVRVAFDSGNPWRLIETWSMTLP